MIYIRSKEEIEKIRESSRIVHETLKILGGEIKPGITTKQLDIIATEYIYNRGGKPAFKGYRGFPASICTSIDEQVVHGIPTKRVLKEGEIISLDVGVQKDGYYGDAAFTYAIGEVDSEKLKLMAITEEALYKGIKMAVRGGWLSDIGHAVQSHVEDNGFSVVRVLVGHGIGRELHEKPEVPNFGDPGRGPKLKSGMCLAIEPMVNAGSYDIEILDDGWTVVTIDRKPSAHFEHTVAITDDGPLILSNGV